VHACRKNDSGALYAVKCINKRLVKVKGALANITEERDVLTKLDSQFVTNLKYAFQDETNLYLVMDLLLGIIPAHILFTLSEDHSAMYLGLK